MKPQTLNDIFFAIVERKQDPVMLVREASQWVPVSSHQFYRYREQIDDLYKEAETPSVA
jgi:hypothetical protein